MLKVLGVSIRLDPSWILLALLIAWSLAVGTFPQLYAGLPRFSYWVMAGATVVGVAASIILHELGHTLVARAFGLPIRSITLFIFGGVAELEGEAKAPVAELLMALAGPAVSVVLGFGFLALAGAVPAAAAQTEIAGVLEYLGILNFTLAIFNMAPAFPLDGGRVLRAVVWLITGDALKATRIAARAGEFIGLLMMVLGAVGLLVSGFAVGGLWWIVLGWFIFSMARAYYAEAETRRLLSGARVGDFMTSQVVTAPADMSVEDFVDSVLIRFPHDLIPVLDGQRVVGAAGFAEVRRIPRDAWGATRLSEVMTPLTALATADENEPVEAALERLQKARVSRMLVMRGGGLAGILTLKDLAAHLQFRAQLDALQHA